MNHQGFDAAWARILELEGEEFRTVSGLPLTYTVEGSILRSSRAKQNLSRSEFEKPFGACLSPDQVK